MAARPSILLVTLDTTRADAIGPEARGIETPAFDALAARGRRFRQAYATVPETLPSHVSMMTGLYPAGHGVHENARYLSRDRPVLAERLREAGYRTAAFVSSFVLARRFGLARGFDVYDDELLAGHAERTARHTTDRVLAYLDHPSSQPVLLWVHYYDPHAPYAPPEPFRSRYAQAPYLGEVAAMDEQLGRLVRAFEERVGEPRAIVVVGDHGEGLGEHGESQHGYLVYQATMRVPLLLVGPGLAPGVSDAPVSTRRVFHTILDWAGLGAEDGLRGPGPEVVLGEAMKPFLSYGWQPQVMGVEGRTKAILAGTLEVYDVVADPAESHDLAATASLSPPARTALRDYPVPALEGQRAPDDLGEEERQKLASLGYVSAGAAPVVRKDAPRPVDRHRLFDLLDTASALFVEEKYGKVIPLLEKILADDPHNLDAALRLATAHSMLGHERAALAAFARAASIVPGSQDVRTYLALHYVRGRRWEKAAPLLEQVVAETKDRLPALEGLAQVREAQGRIEEALALRQKVYGMRAPTAAELVRLGQAAMRAEKTSLAIDAFEKGRGLQGPAFEHHLELGVLYLAARRFAEARDALDRVPASHPEYAMALFKRAQVSVLLNEPDQAARIEAARRRADATTRPLIAREHLFQGAGAR
ncbi:MAG TPA: sulfatase-like hydrolase/transferase [Vicinamibacteria bacterium]|nr:sulfatase-like hydrolase/transferase [Vicinamibacteria bacterium]